MPNDSRRARYESNLARAHRNLYYAQEAAEQLGDSGAAEDIAAMLRHITVMSSDSLNGRKRQQPAMARQMRLGQPSGA